MIGVFDRIYHRPKPAHTADVSPPARLPSLKTPRTQSLFVVIFLKDLQQCEVGVNIIFIPSIVVAEMLSIFDKKRVSFNFKNLFKKIHTSENFVLIALDYPILKKMIALIEVPELHDKIIASTAKYLRVPIIPKDKILQRCCAVNQIQYGTVVSSGH